MIEALAPLLSDSLSFALLHVLALVAATWLRQLHHLQNHWSLAARGLSLAVCASSEKTSLKPLSRPSFLAHWPELSHKLVPKPGPGNGNRATVIGWGLGQGSPPCSTWSYRGSCISPFLSSIYSLFFFQVPFHPPHIKTASSCLEEKMTLLPFWPP